MGTRFKTGMAEAGAPMQAGSAASIGPAQSSRRPVWAYQTAVEGTPEDPDDLYPFDPRHYLYERYIDRDRSAPARRIYYAVRPIVPRRLQLALRRAFVPLQRRAKFPAWPIEPVLVEAQYEHLRNRLRRSGRPTIPFVNFWPDGKRFCCVLTHDVESEQGIEAIPRLLEVEQRHGFTSSWNFCGEEYVIPSNLFEELRAAGCEVGLHGIRHDGKLFASRANFESNLPKIHRYLSDWHADGFRSPATHRNARWMPELGCAYDSSFPDTDPFEPVAGGCCSIFPFFIDGMVEVPITLIQDHTCLEILREASISPWTTKSEWIIHNHGLINLIVHPDYMLSPERLELYERFLLFLSRQEGGWHALPREVAQWWRSRSALEAETVARGDILSEPGLPNPTIAHAREKSGRIVFDVTEGGRRRGRFGQDAPPTAREPRSAPPLRGE